MCTETLGHVIESLGHTLDALESLHRLILIQLVISVLFILLLLAVHATNRLFVRALKQVLRELEAEEKG